MNDEFMDDSAAGGSTKHQREEAPKWTLDSIGELLLNMKGEVKGLRGQVRDVRRTVDHHSEALDNLQLRITEVEAKQAGYSPAPSSFSAASSVKAPSPRPPPGLQSPVSGGSRRDGDEAVVIGAVQRREPEEGRPCLHCRASGYPHQAQSCSAQQPAIMQEEST